MTIKIGNAEFSIHEFILLLLSLLFFAVLFIGSFDFGRMGGLFPMAIGGAGLFLVVLYLISGFLPSVFYNTMRKDTEFQLFGLIPEETQEAMHKEAEDEAEASSAQDMSYNIRLSYLVLALFAAYVLLSYLFGFYISTFIITVAYLSIYRTPTSNPVRALFYKVLLVILLQGAILIFDTSFGHDFMEGAVFKYFQLFD